MARRYVCNPSRLLCSYVSRDLDRVKLVMQVLPQNAVDYFLALLVFLVTDFALPLVLIVDVVSIF